MAYHLKQLDGIVDAKKEGLLKHSYLISGPDGVGKLEFAYLLAKVAACENDNACGRCAGCLEVEKHSSPDLHVLDGEGSIKIEQIRELKKALSLKPYRAARKIAIVPNIERITTEAANSLLKTLEEPAGETVLILTATSSGRLLPTIKSRCQEIKLGLVSSDDIAASLVKEQGVDEGLARQLATFSAGRPALAVRLAEDGNFQKELDYLKAILNAGLAERFQMVKTMAESGDAAKTLDFWEMYFRSLLLSKSGGGPEGMPLPIAGDWSVAKLVNILDNLGKTKEYIESKINIRLVLENLVLNI